MQDESRCKDFKRKYKSRAFAVDFEVSLNGIEVPMGKLKVFVIVTGFKINKQKIKMLTKHENRRWNMIDE